MTDEPIADASEATDQRPLTDPIGLALTAIGAGAVAGAFIITFGVIILRTVQGMAGQTETSSADFTLLSIAVMAGPITAVTLTMLATRAIDDLWRRGVAAAISVFCAFLLSGLAAPIDLIAGRVGLIAFAIGLFIAATWLTRRANAIAVR